MTKNEYGLASLKLKSMIETTMLLSEAIRLGATMAPQAFGQVKSFEERHPIYPSIYDIDFNSPDIIIEYKIEIVYGTCAWGAALDAIGRLHEWMLITPAVLPPHWSKVLNVMKMSECPFCRFPSYSIIHLNDTHKMSRERIANWVQHIEQSYDIVVEPKPVLTPALQLENQLT